MGFTAALKTALFGCALLLTSGYLQAAVAVNDVSEPVSLSGQWQYQLGDDAAWANPEFDDTAWSSTQVPAHSPAGHSGYSGMLWYRLALQLDLSSSSVEQNIGALAVTMGNVRSAYALYAGGILVGEVGRLPPEPAENNDLRTTWSIPRSAIDADGTLVLALRVWRDPKLSDVWPTGPHYGDFLLGNVGELREQLTRKAIWPEAILAVVYVVFGIYHLLIARANPGLKEFLWFGLCGIVLGIYTFESSQAKFLLDIPFEWHKKLEYLSLYLVPVLSGLTMLSVSRTSAGFFIRGLHIVFLVYFVAAIVLPGTEYLIASLRSFQYLLAVWLVSMLVAMALQAQKGNRGAIGVLVLLVLLLITVFTEVILQTSLLGSGRLLHVVLALVLLGISLMMAQRYTQILRNLEAAVSQRTNRLVETNRELAAAVETKGQFLANMSHEMRTPMNAILGFARLGMQATSADEQADYLKKVEHSGKEMLRIVDSVLDFSRLSDGNYVVEPEPFSPSDLVGDIKTQWQQRVESAGLAFKVSVGDDLPVALAGDMKCLKQVLGHLIDNAIKFTEQGDVSLGLTVVKQDDSQASLQFSVVDTGVGIGQGQKDTLFEAFSQGDNSTTREHGGTGLGLSIAQGLVELMGGAITLESIEGQGSTFSFVLEMPLADAVRAKNHAGNLDMTPVRGAKVLLVDDSDLNLQVAGELLRKAQLYVDVACDGAEAVEKVFANTYDCVFMDVQMPVMDGYSATRAIRANPDYATLPVLAMTANVLPQDRALGEQAGMNAYIPKPIDPDVLYAALLQWITPGERAFEESAIEDVDAEGEATSFPDTLPGLNIAEALRRVGGNQKLYLNLLKDLAADYSDVVGRLEVMLSGGETEPASQLAHKLRGIANNLGAYDLGESAESLELDLKAGKAAEPAALARLQAALALIIESHGALMSQVATESDASALDPAQREEVMQQLRDAISSNNPDAQEIAESLLASTPEGEPDHAVLAAVIEALDIFDFASAEASMANLQ